MGWKDSRAGSTIEEIGFGFQTPLIQPPPNPAPKTSMPNENTPSSYINYLDASSLYSLVMCQKLPNKDIKFVDNFTEEQLNTWDDMNVGFILAVDLEYPKELHDKHVDFPMAPEIMNVTTDMLSE